MVVVTGAPRTGTSLVMQTLNILGFPVTGEKFSDYNIPDCNQKGYYELPIGEIDTGIKDNRYNGKAVKLFAQGLLKTIENTIEKVIVCVRDESESIKSFKLLLEKSPFRAIKPTINNATQIVRYNAQIARIYSENCKKPTIKISFKRMINNTENVIEELCSFLGITPTDEQKKEAIENIMREV